jgi:hypothetical protein
MFEFGGVAHKKLKIQKVFVILNLERRNGIWKHHLIKNIINL